MCVKWDSRIDWSAAIGANTLNIEQEEKQTLKDESHYPSSEEGFLEKLIDFNMLRPFSFKISHIFQ